MKNNNLLHFSLFMAMLFVSVAVWGQTPQSLDISKGVSLLHQRVIKSVMTRNRIIPVIMSFPAQQLQIRLRFRQGRIILH